MARTKEQPALSSITGGVELALPNFARGFQASLPNRHELLWVGGAQGTPALLADATTSIGSHAPVNQEMLVQGTNMTSALATLAVDGGVTLTTAGADGDQAIMSPHTLAKSSGWAGAQWNTDRQLVFQCRFRTGANITSTIIGVGLKLTVVAGATTLTGTTDNDQTFLRYQDAVNGGRFQAWDSNTNVDTTTDTGITVAVSTSYLVQIYVDSTRVPHYYINGNLVANGSALVAALTTLIPFVAVAASGAAAAKAVTVRSMSMAQEYL